MGNAGTRTGVVIVFLLGTQFKAQVFDYTVINSTHSFVRQAGTSRARVHLWNSRQQHTMHNCIIHNQQHINQSSILLLQITLQQRPAAE